MKKDKCPHCKKKVPAWSNPCPKCGKEIGFNRKSRVINPIGDKHE